MLTFTKSLNTYKTLTDSSSANETFGTLLLNESIRAVTSIRSGRWKWLETLKQVYTLSNIQTYPVPNDVRHITDIYVQTDSGSAIWYPEIVYDPIIWKKVLSAKLGYGDVPRFVYVQNNTMYFSPIPQTNGNTIYLRGRLNIRDMGIADYTTGTIVTVPYTTTITAVVASGDTSATLSGAWALSSGTYQVKFSSGEIRLATLTNGATTCTWTDALTESGTTAITVSSSTGGTIITGSGTFWTTGMEGRYIQIASTSASNGGDNFWYKVVSVESTTVLILDKEYLGEAITAGSATYTLGEVSPIPEAYQIAPVYRSVALYWQNKGESKKAEMFWRMYDGGVEAGYTKEYGGIISQMMESEGSTVEGAYIPPTDFYGRINPNNPEPDVATSSFL